MRIGINLSAFKPGVSGGIEFYARNLLRALAEIDITNQYYLFTNRDNHDSFNVVGSNFKRILAPLYARPQLKRIWWEQIQLPGLARRLSLNVLHSLSYTWPILSRVPGVVTICDMLYKVYPESIEAKKLAFWRLFIPWSARRCRYVLTISQSSRRDIIRFLGIPRDKVIVTPLALDHQIKRMQVPASADIKSVLAKYCIVQPYILYVGGVGCHKNPFALIDALVRLHQRPETQAVHVVITGNDYAVRRKIETAIAASKLGEYVHLPGYVKREDLPELYAGAVVYAAPSLFEGFGLTLLEAMAYGIPVVSSNRSSLPEVTGDAALIVDPEDVGAFTDALFRVIVDKVKRTWQIERGLERIKTFSWQETARLTLGAYVLTAQREGANVELL